MVHLDLGLPGAVSEKRALTGPGRSDLFRLFDGHERMASYDADAGRVDVQLCCRIDFRSTPWGYDLEAHPRQCRRPAGNNTLSSTRSFKLFLDESSQRYS